MECSSTATAHPVSAHRDVALHILGAIRLRASERAISRSLCFGAVSSAGAWSVTGAVAPSMARCPSTAWEAAGQGRREGDRRADRARQGPCRLRGRPPRPPGGENPRRSRQATGTTPGHGCRPDLHLETARCPSSLRRRGLDSASRVRPATRHGTAGRTAHLARSSGGPRPTLQAPPRPQRRGRTVRSPVGR